MYNEEEEEALREIWEEMRIEALYSNPIISGFSYRSFVSKSAGRNRKRKRWVEVELIGLPGGRTVSMMNGHLPKTKKTRMDCVAEEAVGNNCPLHLQPLDYFLSLLREREQRSKR